MFDLIARARRIAPEIMLVNLVLASIMLAYSCQSNGQFKSDWTAKVDAQAALAPILSADGHVAKADQAVVVIHATSKEPPIVAKAAEAHQELGQASTDLVTANAAIKVLVAERDHLAEQGKADQAKFNAELAAKDAMIKAQGEQITAFQDEDDKDTKTWLRVCACIALAAGGVVAYLFGSKGSVIRAAAAGATGFVMAIGLFWAAAHLKTVWTCVAITGGVAAGLVILAAVAHFRKHKGKAEEESKAREMAAWACAKWGHLSPEQLIDKADDVLDGPAMAHVREWIETRKPPAP